MEVKKTGFAGLLVIEPRVFKDDRGFFFESFNKNNLRNVGVTLDFVQDNQSKSSYGVIRGLHYQKPPHAQTKLVRVLQGKILDVVVDIRKGSPTYGKSYSIELSDENFLQFLVPKGFAHGFSVLSETAVILYKCDDFYHPETEGSIKYNDKTLCIDWKVEKDKIVVSEKDFNGLDFEKLDSPFVFGD
jgi:dTDP-4-dehydrorhamnose 3,5-epimerase